jgi:hypothetical protein
VRTFGYSSTTSADAADFFTASAAVRAFDFDAKLSPDVAVVCPFELTRRHRYYNEGIMEEWLTEAAASEHAQSVDAFVRRVLSDLSADERDVLLAVLPRLAEG